MDLLALFFILIFCVLIWEMSVHQKKRYARIVHFLNGKYTWFGTVSFNIQNQKFQISNVGTGNIGTGGGGSYHRLKLVTEKHLKIFLGPTTSHKYISVGKIPDSFRKFSIRDRDFMIQLETIETSELLKTEILQNQDLQNTLIELLKKDFQYLQSSTTIVIENFKLKKKNYHELSFIEHTYLENFDEFQNLLRLFQKMTDFLQHH